MYRKIALAGVTAAAIVGVGTAALATSGAETTNGTARTHAAGKQHRHAMLRHVLHAEFTTKGKDGYVTHAAIRGTVTTVNATSITVRALDGFSQSFTLSDATKIRERPVGTGKGTPGTVSDLKTGDKVGVLGKAPKESTADPTATVVIDGLKK